MTDDSRCDLRGDPVLLNGQDDGTREKSSSSTLSLADLRTSATQVKLDMRQHPASAPTRERVEAFIDVLLAALRDQEQAALTSERLRIEDGMSHINDSLALTARAEKAEAALQIAQRERDEEIKATQHTYRAGYEQGKAEAEALLTRYERGGYVQCLPECQIFWCRRCGQQKPALRHFKGSPGGETHDFEARECTCKLADIRSSLRPSEAQR